MRILLMHTPRPGISPRSFVSVHKRWSGLAAGIFAEGGFLSKCKMAQIFNKKSAKKKGHKGWGVLAVRADISSPMKKWQIFSRNQKKFQQFNINKMQIVGGFKLDCKRHSPSLYIIYSKLAR